MISHTRIVKIFAVVLLLSCVLVWGDAMKVRCIGREREALVSFKNSLIDEVGMLSSWRGEECCNWYGVVCSNTTGNVISLLLGASNINLEYTFKGKFTPSLLDLHHLTSLDLRWNDFGGHPIPDFIGSMKQLQHLCLKDCGFTGTVPPHLGNLTNLRTLDLSDNSLNSKNLNWLSSLSLLSHLDLSYFFDLNHTSLLQQIPHLPSLKELHLRFCNIRDDTLPVGLFVNSSSSSSLSILDLQLNRLTTSALNWLSNVSSSLVQIDLSFNDLSGPIPDVFERYIHLEFLDLSHNMLQVDEIPKSLSNLTHLRVLFLSYNGLSGQLDELVGNISASSGILGSLETLSLAYNQFTGSVPDLTPFSALTEVYLGSNKLTGTLPLSVGNLRDLDLSYNNLEGSVSESHFIKLHNIKSLDLSSNSLKLNIAPDWIPPFQLETMVLAGCKVGPSFPKWIRTQTNLTHLHLSNASIVDEVPTWLWSFSPSLQYLFLSQNQITGTIPDLSSISLHVLDVSDNKFSGLIPLFHPLIQSIQLNQNMFFGSISSICEIRYDSLRYIDLSNNQFSGELPSCWDNIPNLIALALGSNSFSNKIPHSVGSLRYLEALQLRDNNLFGELPSTLRFCHKLDFIDVRGNKLTGDIPDWIGEIDNLQVLNIARNRLHGSIPLSICNLSYLRILDIHMNNLFGKIPHCFHTWENPFSYHYFKEYTLPLGYLRFDDEYTSVGWKGQESEYTNNLYLLGLFDFSCNRFTGNIPQTFSSVWGLRSLNLSGNILTGNIFPDIGQMEMLESLDLSNNQLSGEIPTSLAELHFLSVLDLSNNNLSGKIPSSTQLQSFDASCYAGNNGLCGQPLTMCPQHTIPRGEKGDVYWRLSFMQECGISMAFGFIFGFWGLIGSFILKKSWRCAFFNLMDATGEWLCLRYEMNMKQR